MYKKARYHVFLSHNSIDKPAVEELARRLVKAGIHPWLDTWNLIPGEPWQEAIEEALERCTACAVFIGPSGAGPWQNEEMRAAIDRRVRESDGRFRVIPVLLPGAERGERGRLPAFLAATTWVEFRRSLDDEDAVHRLACGVRGVEPGPTPGQAIYEGECPYRGLQFFDVEHAPFFFGREALTEWLLNELRPSTGSGTGGDNRFLAIIGPSGSGKSSLARAGLVAALKRGEIEGSANWPVAICRPGPDPLESLAVALSPSTLDALDLISKFRDNERTLHITARVALRNAPSGHRLVVLVDQFEELFTLCHNEDLRQALVDNLLYAASVAEGRTAVLLALRADFYGKCAPYPALAAALSDHQLLVGPMADDELRRAIERPAQLAGCEFEPGLVETLLRDIKDQPSGLPLLQHALLELWGQREGRRLTYGAYQAIGRVEGALQQRAEAVYSCFTEPEREICRRIFLRLMQPSEGAEDSKRRVPMQELLPAKGQQEMVEAVVQTLSSPEARLVTIEGGAVLNEERIVEVAHEALIHSWSRLRNWIEENREALRIYRRLTEAAREWNQHGRDLSYLYRGARLTEAVECARAYASDLSKFEAAFLEASVTEQQQEREVKEALYFAQGRIAATEAMLTRTTIAADLAHRMSNLAGTIPVWVNIIRERLDQQSVSDEVVEDSLNGIESDTARILRATEDLQKPVEKQPIDVNQILNSLVREVSAQTPSKIHIGLSCERRIPPVYAAKEELRLSLRNFIENSVDAMPDGGNIEVSSASCTGDDGQQWVEIKVSDEGIGISEEASKRIFSLFYTTKPGHMGYGLWRSRNIIQSIGGTIEALNNPHRGITFIIRLPAFRKEVENEK
jgi:signal transduction histidine kinase